MNDENPKAEVAVLYCDLDNDPNRDPDRPHEPGEVRELLDRETQVSMDISQAISQYSDLYKATLYDLIMAHTEEATKEDFIFLLTKIGRPSDIRDSQKEKKHTLLGLLTHMAFNDVTIGENGEVTYLGKPKKGLIIDWLDALEPENNIERLYKNSYLDAKKHSQESNALRFKGIYNQVVKDLLKYKT